MEQIFVTPANVHDGRAGPAALPDDPGIVYAGSGYRSQAFANAVTAKGVTPHVVQTVGWGRERDGVPERLKSWNYEIQQHPLQD